MQHQLLLKFYGEVLPYLEIKKQEEALKEVEVPNLIGLTIKEAKEKLESLNLDYKLNEKENSDGTIYEQLPKAGVKVKEKTKIQIYL